jgi:hypothetical protein
MAAEAGDVSPSWVSPISIGSPVGLLLATSLSFAVLQVTSTTLYLWAVPVSLYQITYFEVRHSDLPPNNSVDGSLPPY